MSAGKIDDADQIVASGEALSVVNQPPILPFVFGSQCTDADKAYGKLSSISGVNLKES